jgi:hypothetical protein
MKYYVERAESGFIGNCLLFWRKGGHGYSCDLAEAEVFDDADPSFINITNERKYRVWEKDYIDACAILHVDSGKLNFNRAGIIYDESKE